VEAIKIAVATYINAYPLVTFGTVRLYLQATSPGKDKEAN